MRIGVVAHDLDANTGGGYTFHHTVLRALRKIRSRHEIFVLAHGNVSEELGPSENWSVVELASRYAQREVASPVQAAVNEFELDLVWFLHPLSEVLTVPIFVTVWDLEHRKQPYFPEVSHSGWDWDKRESHYSTVLPRAARIFTGTQTGRDEIVRFYRVDDENVVVNPFAISSFIDDHGTAGGEEIISRHAIGPGFLFYPAQFWPHKNHVNLLLALKRLETGYGIVRDLVLTGYDAGNMDHVRRTANELGLEKRVKFLGFVARNEVAALYRNAGALVYPSFFGPDNLPPLEAFALGCPVVASDIKGAAEEIGAGAMLFDPTDPDDIAAQVARVLGERLLRRELVAKGVGIAIERTPEAYARRALKVIDEFEPYRRNWRNDFYCK